jgi:hypothetical protein
LSIKKTLTDERIFGYSKFGLLFKKEKLTIQNNPVEWTKRGNPDRGLDFPPICDQGGKYESKKFFIGVSVGSSGNRSICGRGNPERRRRGRSGDRKEDGDHCQ